MEYVLFEVIGIQKIHCFVLDEFTTWEKREAAHTGRSRGNGRGWGRASQAVTVCLCPVVPHTDEDPRRSLNWQAIQMHFVQAPLYTLLRACPARLPRPWRRTPDVCSTIGLMKFRATASLPHTELFLKLMLMCCSAHFY